MRERKEKQAHSRTPDRVDMWRGRKRAIYCHPLKILPACTQPPLSYPTTHLAASKELILFRGG